MDTGNMTIWELMSNRAQLKTLGEADGIMDQAKLYMQGVVDVVLLGFVVDAASEFAQVE